MNDPKSTKVKVLFYIDTITTIIFTIEAALKIVSYGFIKNGHASYLRDIGNLIDFLIVVLSIVNLIPMSVNLNVIKGIRLMKVIRPLRVINRNSGLKLAV